MGARLPEELYYTWEDLGELLGEGPARVREEILGAPRRWRRALALALAVAKWAPTRVDLAGYGVCGLCLYYRMGRRRSCGRCPLRWRWGCTCGADDSPWRAWDNLYGDPGIKRAADRIYDDLVALYTAELRRLGWLGEKEG